DGDVRGESGYPAVREFLVSERDERPDRRRALALAIREPSADVELRSVRQLDEERSEPSLVPTEPGHVREHARLAVVERLHLEEGVAAAHFVAALRPPRHEPFAAESFDSRELLLEMVDPAAWFMSVDARIGMIAASHDRLDVRHALFECPVERRR